MHVEPAIFEFLGKITVRVVVDVILVFGADEDQQVIMPILMKSVNDQMITVHGANR